MWLFSVLQFDFRLGPVMYRSNYLFIYQVALARRQPKDLSSFASSHHLPICLSHTVKASNCRFNAEHDVGKLWIPSFVVFG